jgi:hypothetical protein
MQLIHTQYEVAIKTFRGLLRGDRVVAGEQTTSMIEAFVPSSGASSGYETAKRVSRVVDIEFRNCSMVVSAIIS